MHEAVGPFLLCQVSGVVVGEGFRFGYKASGDTSMLQELGQRYGIQVSVVQLVGSAAAESTIKVHAALSCAVGR